MAKKTYCKCDALARNKKASWVWRKALLVGAMATRGVCEECGYGKWTFPSAQATKKWFKMVKEG